MSQFTTNFKGELIGKNFWKNLERFEYHVGHLGSEEIISVPEDFETDFASVPRIFWAVISPVDKHAKAAVIHDYCYYYARKRCDEIFKEALEVLEVSPWKVWCMYQSVRVGGYYAWWKHRRREKKERLVEAR